MSFVLSFMEILNQVRMFMLKCLWVSHSKLWMGPEWCSSWRRPFMDFVKVHEHFGSILPKGSQSLWIGKSRLNPCLLVWTKVIWFVSLLMTSSFGTKIQWISMAQQCYCMSLASTLWEDDVARFLELTLDWDPETGLLEIKQTGLIIWVIKALGLDDRIVKWKYSPSESKPLVKNLNDEAASGAFSYINVVGMLLYLFRHIRPDITFLSIVVLDTCSVLNICMSSFWNA